MRKKGVSRQVSAPFPYIGGKTLMAGVVWELLGNVDNYIEPFAGSAAVLLLRPEWHLKTHRLETINDAFAYISNFWRAVAKDPEGVAAAADWPCNETDMRARHRYLLDSPAGVKFRERMSTDPDYFNTKIAGWWCWGQCLWIMSGWCSLANGSSGKRPQLGSSRGIFKQPAAAAGLAPSRGQRSQWILDWFELLQNRLRDVRICCGDWTRVCDSKAVTTNLGVTGIFLDPPYGEDAGRVDGLYGVDSQTVAKDVRDYCVKYGGDTRFRITLAGYEGEGHEELERHGWQVRKWTSQSSSKNSSKERLWFSPHSIGSRARSPARPVWE